MKLFGTDGIRGEAGVEPLNRETLRRVGRALARHLEDPTPRILMGRDTRASGPDLEKWLQEGIRAGGGETVSAGIITTPAIAVLTRRFRFSAGLMISASHNPFPDNGVKVFSAEGCKASEALESAIEADVAQATDDAPGVEEGSPLSPDPALHDEYTKFLESTLPPSTKFPSLRMILDCANGAAHQVGPNLLARLGLEVSPMGVSPDGRNINLNCGSTHPEEMARRVVERGFDLGAALDGDGDRLLLADHRGRIVDGDAILLLCGRRLKRESRLSASGIVATVMSNLALEKTLEQEGIRLCRTQVGDKYVAEEMTRRGMSLGGEQSGHIIFSDFSPSGDGLLTLLQVLRVMAAEGKPLAELANLEPYPQILINVRVSQTPEIASVPEISRAMDAAERQLGGRGRILVRYSGTEPLLRIMMEGPEEPEIRTLSESIGDAARKTIGDP